MHIIVFSPARDKIGLIILLSGATVLTDKSLFESLCFTCLVQIVMQMFKIKDASSCWGFFVIFFSVVRKPIAVFLKSLLSFAPPQDLYSLFLLALWTMVPSGGGVVVSTSTIEGSHWLGQK